MKKRHYLIAVSILSFFKQQTRLHALDYDFDIKRAREEAINQSPQAHLMLVAFLTQKFATEMALSASQNRQEACERLGIDVPTRYATR